MIQATGAKEKVYGILQRLLKWSLKIWPSKLAC